MKKEIYKIGIDVGGTNTDGVLVNQEEKIVAKTKQSTTQDIILGIDRALEELLKQSRIDPDKVEFVMLGTTHCTNAIVERKGLNKVGVIRLCKPAGQAIPPLTGFPKDLIAFVGKHVHMVNGGYEFDGRVISPIDEDEIRTIVRNMKDEVDSLAVTGIFSKSNPGQELRVAEIAKEELGKEVKVSMSHLVGGLGLLERENATIINASLQSIAAQMADSFEKAVIKHNINASLFFGQNDGTLMSVEDARKFPVLTIACGPTNSIRGAGALSEMKDAIVIDVGGTTTDAGILVNGFPRESSRTNEIGGVKTNFRMPDVLSIGLGGGSIILEDNEGIQIGPESVGYLLPEKAVAFGGDTFTMTDYALINGLVEIDGTISGQNLKESLGRLSTNAISELIKVSMGEKLTLLLDKLKTENKEIPVIICGGGSVILPKLIDGASKVIKPLHFEVANAYGACIAKVGGAAEQVFNLLNNDREEAIALVTRNAKEMAQTAGALPQKIEVLEIQETPLAYLPNMTKIKVKVCGDLSFS